MISGGFRYRILSKSALAAADPKAALSDLHQKIAGLVGRLAKLYERVTRIAHAVAQSNLVR